MSSIIFLVVIFCIVLSSLHVFIFIYSSPKLYCYPPKIKNLNNLPLSFTKQATFDIYKATLGDRLLVRVNESRQDQRV
jgi:hypothetical protein